MAQVISEFEIALQSAVKLGQLDEVSRLLKDHEFLRVKQHEENSLFETCLRNHARETVKVFLAEDPTLAIKIGYSKAHEYAEHGELNKLVEVLQVQPELLHVTDIYGNTPLHLAATQGNLEVVQYLHKQGAILTAVNADKNTPLQLALLFDPFPEKNAVKYLINQNCIIQDVSFDLHLPQKQPVELKRITQEGWDIFVKDNIENNSAEQLISVSSLLRDAGYLPYLKHIHIGGKIKISNVDFTGIDFNHAIFNGVFSNVKFENSQIAHCEFDHAYFNHAEFSEFNHFIGTTFTDTYFKNSVFSQNQFSQALFSHSSFESTTLIHSNFDQVFISHSNLLGLTIDQPQHIQILLDNSVYNPDLIEKFANNIQLLNTDAPIIGLISRPGEIIYGGEVGMTGADPYARLKQYGTTPVLLDMTSIRDKIDFLEFNNEIQNILESVPEGVNIPKYVLSQKAENLDIIKTLANDYGKHLDAVWIPGGPDVHPEFYGQSNMGSQISDYNYIREIFEFALIDHMVINNKPLMGICHGSQITNVYFGGTLKQDIEGHLHNYHLILPIGKLAGESGPVSQVLNEATIGLSNHHQAIDTLGEGLQAVGVSGPMIENFMADYNHNIQTVIEASEGTKGNPIMLFQFHPEYNLDNVNRNILKQFVNLTIESKQTHALADTTVLNVNDMLDSDELFTADDFSAVVPSEPMLTSVYVSEPITHLFNNQTEVLM